MPFNVTLTALVEEHELVTPLTTLIQNLVEDGKTPGEAHDLVKDTFNIDESIDLGSFDHLEEAKANNEAAKEVLLATNLVNGIAVNAHHLLTGSAGVEVEDPTVAEALNEAIYEAVSELLQKGNLDLENPAHLETIISKATSNAAEIFSNLEIEVDIDETTIEEIKDEVAEVLVAGNTKQRLLSEQTADISEFLTVSTKGKKVIYGKQAEALNQLGKGEVMPETVVEEHATTDETALQEILQVSLPPEMGHIDDVFLLEDETISDYKFTVFDRDTPLDLLSLTAVSSNPELLPNDNISIALGENSDTATLGLTPEPDKFGFAQVTLTVEDERGHQLSQQFAVDVLSVNDTPEFKGSSMLEVVAGDSVTITSTELLAQDADGLAEELEYILIQAPSGGNLSLEDTILENDSIFSQADINSGKLIYHHQGENTDDSFDFVVRDTEGAETSTLTAKIEIASFNLIGSSGNDLLNGNSEPNFMSGKQGDDTVNGGNGNDSIFGGNGSDILDGEGGKDFLNGADGNDTLKGGDDDDKAYGWNGSDYLLGGTGNDYLHGGGENDILFGGVGDDTLNGWSDSDSLSGDEGNDYLNGWAGSDSLSGDEGNDTLEGSWGQDILQGGTGDDFLYGGKHFDKLFADAGNDYLDGGTGVTILEGGDGADIFVIHDDAQTDWIRDFDLELDTIGLADGLIYEELDIVDNEIYHNGDRIAKVKGLNGSPLAIASFSEI